MDQAKLYQWSHRRDFVGDARKVFTLPGNVRFVFRVPGIDELSARFMDFVLLKKKDLSVITGTQM